MNKIKTKISEYFSEGLNKYRFITIILFLLVITLLAWQSDDAYHAYAMAKNLVDRNDFVYNNGERASE